MSTQLASSTERRAGARLVAGPRRGLRMGGLVAAGALAAASCGGDSGSNGGGETVTIEATPAAVARSAGISADEPARVEMSLSLGAGEPIVLASGAVDGERFEMVSDLGAMMEALGEQLDEAPPPDAEELDMTMEVKGDASTMYVRMPLLTGLLTFAASEADLDLGAGAELEDAWLRFDFDSLEGLLSDEELEALPFQSPGRSDPRAFLELLSEVGEVEDLGREEVRGVAVSGLAADVTLRDFFEIAETELVGLADIDPGEEALFERLLELSLPVEVWIDDEGLIRRVAVELDFEEIVEVSADEDLAELAELGEQGLLRWSFTMDFFDYGEPISIELPEDAVDMTEALVAFEEAGIG